VRFAGIFASFFARKDSSKSHKQSQREFQNQQIPNFSRHAWFQLNTFKDCASANLRSPMLPTNEIAFAGSA
jgi:hypothetical protein